MSPRKGSGSGIHACSDGYLRISRRGPLRDQMAHRAYVNRQLAESGLPPLSATEEIYHLCRNRACWPPTDFHLVIMDARLHDASDSGRHPRIKQYASKVNAHEYETMTAGDADVTADEDNPI